MATQPKQGDSMHVDTHTYHSLIALCTVFTLSYELVYQKQNDVLLLRVPHVTVFRNCTETLCDAFVVPCTAVLPWAEPRFLVGQELKSL